MKKVSITDVCKIVEAHEARKGIVLLFGEDRKFEGTSYGATKAECASVRITLDEIFDALVTGEIRGPK